MEYMIFTVVKCNEQNFPEFRDVMNLNIFWLSLNP